jgi:hypothetical protein
LVAFCPGDTARNVDLQRLFEAGYLHAAVVSRPTSAQATTPHRPEFNDLFFVVTASNSSRLSAVSSAPP